MPGDFQHLHAAPFRQRAPVLTHAAASGFAVMTCNIQKITGVAGVHEGALPADVFHLFKKRSRRA